MSTHDFNGWIPGVLSKRQVRELCEKGYIQGLDKPNRQIDHSSFDLTLTRDGYHMKEGAMKPSGDYEHFLRQLKQEHIAEQLIPHKGAYRLEAKQTYVFKLKESLGPQIRTSAFYGQATAKSSVGRVDVLARLIVDGMDSYESFTPEGAASGNGHMYLEITPITFPVLVKDGTSLTQLRLFFGNPSDCEIKGGELHKSVLLGSNGDGCLSVDLSDVQIASSRGCAFKAKSNPLSKPVALWPVSPKPDPADYWTLEKSRIIAGTKCVNIEKESFYILRSKELIALPSGVAVYCRAIDETIGEMRIHYAGFVHPFFGRDRSDHKIGTPLIFEVRGHDVGVVLKDGEKLARLTFYRMAEDSRHSQPGDYGEQTLKLSNFFNSWN